MVTWEVLVWLGTILMPACVEESCKLKNSTWSTNWWNLDDITGGLSKQALLEHLQLLDILPRTNLTPWVEDQHIWTHLSWGSSQLNYLENLGSTSAANYLSDCCHWINVSRWISDRLLVEVSIILRNVFDQCGQDEKTMQHLLSVCVFSRGSVVFSTVPGWSAAASTWAKWSHFYQMMASFNATSQ